MRSDTGGAGVSLAWSWTIQRRVLWALILREMLTRYGRHNIGFLWLFVEPMLFPLGVTAIWTALKSVHGSNLPIVAFAITGYSTVLLWRNMPSRCVGAVEPNLSLLYHRNVRIMDIFLSRLLLEAGGATISFVVLANFFMLIGWLGAPEDVLKIAVGWLMIAWFGAALGMMLGALSEESELVDKLWHPVAYLLFPLSGAGFLVDALPTQAQNLILLLPMVNGVECVRDGYFGSQIVAHYDLGYMAVCNMVLTWFALSRTRKVNETVVPQ